MQKSNKVEKHSGKNPICILLMNKKRGDHLDDVGYALYIRRSAAI